MQTTQTNINGKLADESATEALAKLLAQALSQLADEHEREHKNLPGWGSDNKLDNGLVIYLEGNLGAGKSFFTRALIQSFLPGQKVKSPTYTLVETYEGPLGEIHHFDLYRLCDPEELEFLGIRDLLKTHFLSLVEWPSKGEGVLQGADLVIHLQYASELGEGEGRSFTITPVTDTGGRLAKKLSELVKNSGMEFGSQDV
ncbi:tRNA (adenosine(37)-N6)-threonylcarbamoyltransferase complex ATPase subunit type 1 TsaE [Hydrogenovibrio kuenenii]|uniref:tRNA (adenosine(37)-N6)-threonylcarbamoyltransferase complex ATPase subunit type 1 TsaE n=1 Tax=Hydrogenovibrio kuenenii TaxID=63658 RepID=UPI000467B5DE|nr:tRNA (adenosine(37)-N6)-threonylcarbamoyltransferase complex ATPase subunit type 1 TsaE [Hydrogenovibrio kuenenii]